MSVSNVSRELLGEIDSFLAQHGMSDHKFGKICRDDTGLVGRLRRNMPISIKLRDDVRRFIARYNYSEGPIEAVTAPMPAVDALAARVASDQGRAAIERAKLRDPVAKVMAMAGPETPGDAIRLVASRWPDTWAGIVVAARARQIAPGAMMMQLLQDGLAAQADAA